MDVACLAAVCLHQLGREVLVRAADGAHQLALVEEARQAEIDDLDLSMIVSGWGSRLFARARALYRSTDARLRVLRHV